MIESINLNPVLSLIACEDKLTPPQWRVSFVLYKNVKNSSAIHKKLLKGEIKAALIKPSIITDVFQVTVAANCAVRAYLMDKMSTKSLYTEVLYNLSSTKKIANALQTFGIGNEDKEILAVVVYSDDSEDGIENLNSQIDGDICPIDDLASLKNENVIKKIYKISDTELNSGAGSLLDSVLGRMACKEFSVT